MLITNHIIFSYYSISKQNCTGEILRVKNKNPLIPIYTRKSHLRILDAGVIDGL